LSYNDRLEKWAEEHSKKLKILYVIWSVVLVVSVIGFATGFFDDITFDANKVPVGFMDKGTFNGELTQDIVRVPQLPVQGYETEWDCEGTDQFGTVEQCNEYWDNILEYTEENGRIAMLVKLNDDGHLSDAVKSFIFETEGIELP